MKNLFFFLVSGFLLVACGSGQSVATATPAEFTVSIEEVDEAIMNLDVQWMESCATTLTSALDASSSEVLIQGSPNVRVYVNISEIEGVSELLLDGVAEGNFGTVDVSLYWYAPEDLRKGHLAMIHECGHALQFANLYQLFLESGVTTPEQMNHGYAAVQPMLDNQFRNELAPWKIMCQKAYEISLSDPAWFDSQFPPEQVQGDLCRSWKMFYIDQQEQNADGLFGGQVMLRYLQLKGVE